MPRPSTLRLPAESDKENAPPPVAANIFSKDPFAVIRERGVGAGAGDGRAEETAVERDAFVVAERDAFAVFGRERVVEGAGFVGGDGADQGEGDDQGEGKGQGEGEGRGECAGQGEGEGQGEGASQGDGHSEGEGDGRDEGEGVYVLDKLLECLPTVVGPVDVGESPTSVLEPAGVVRLGFGYFDGAFGGVGSDAGRRGGLRFGNGDKENEAPVVVRREEVKGAGSVVERIEAGAREYQSERAGEGDDLDVAMSEGGEGQETRETPDEIAVTPVQPRVLRPLSAPALRSPLMDITKTVVGEASAEKAERTRQRRIAARRRKVLSDRIAERPPLRMSMR